MADQFTGTTNTWRLAFDEPSSQLGRALEEYLHQLELGSPPSVDQFAAAYPEIEGELRESIAKLDALGRVADGIESAEQLAGLRIVAPLPAFLGDYKIIREIGRGGMGVVYEAEQVSLGRRVALKTLPFSALLDERRIVRFKNEAAAAASLDHPNIVSVYGVGCEQGTHYYAMQLVQGCTLADVIAERGARRKENPTDDEQAAETLRDAADSTLVSSTGVDYYRRVAAVGRQAADALHAAHQQGVVHRDIKPSNLLVDASGIVMVADFGLAATQADATLTRTGELLGTLRYMCPEQAEGGGVVDHRADIYGLGATLFELLTGRPIIAAEGNAEALRELLDKAPTKQARLDRRVPCDLATIVEKATAQRPIDRYATAELLAEDLQRFLDHKPVIARRPSALRKSASWVRRNRLTTALLSLLLMSLVVVAVGGLTYSWRLAGEQRKLTDEQARLQRSLYARDIALAQQLIDDGALTQAENHLLKWMASPETREERGFEWFYLWRRCRENAADAILRHPADTYHAVHLPDSNAIVTASFSEELNVWNADSLERRGNELIETEHRLSIVTLAMSPDGRWLVSGDGANNVCLWDTRAREMVERFTVEDTSGSLGVTDLAFSHDGSLLAIATNRFNHSLVRKAQVVVRDLDSKRFIASLHRLGGCPRVGFAPDRTLYATSSTGELRTWKPASGAEATEPAGVELPPRRLGGQPIWCSRLTTDGRRLITSSGPLDDQSTHQRIDIWNTDDWTKAWSFPLPNPGRATEMACYADRWLVVGGSVGHLTLIDLQQEAAIATRKVHDGPIFGLEFSADGRQILSASLDNTARVWGRDRFASGARETIADIQSTRSLSGAIFAADEHSCWRCSWDGLVERVALVDGGVEQSVEVECAGGNMTMIDADAEGRLLAVSRGVWPSDKIGRFIMYDVSDRSGTPVEKWSTRFHDGIITPPPRFSPDSRFVAVASLDQLHIFTSDDGNLVRTFDYPWAKNVVFSRDGRQLAISQSSHTVIVDTSGWTERARYETAEWITEAVDFSPDGSMLVTSDDASRMNLWSVASGQRIARTEPLSDFITYCKYSPDGDRIMAVAKNGHVYLLHAETLQPLIDLPSQPGWTFHGGFSRDGTKLIVGVGPLTRVFDAGKIGQLQRLNVKQLREIVCGPLAGTPLPDQSSENSTQKN